MDMRRSHFTTSYSWLSILLAFLTVVVQSSTSENQDSQCKSNDESCKANTKQDNQCQIYLAESSIPNAGLGMYTTFELKENDYLQSEISIPLIDMDKTILDDYSWNGNYRGLSLEAHSTKDIIPGIGMAANSALTLENVKLVFPTEINKNIGEEEDVLYVDRDTPDVGSFSDYAMYQWSAAKDIPAGMELFANYGDNYFAVRPIYKDIPLTGSYKEAYKIILDFLGFIKHNLDLTKKERQELWDERLKSVPIRTYNALPKEVDSLLKAIKKGIAMHALPNVIRSKDWLQENGFCMDNIIVKKTTIPNHQGRGAFAKRFLPKGSLVAPAPLLHFKNNTIFNMMDVEYDPRISKDTVTLKDYMDDDVVPKQLFINYCFGHSDSSLVLFPYSSRVQLINHDSKNYNVMLRWSTSNLYNSSWLDLSWTELPDRKQGLMMDIIATRDINEGEEIFLNYGDEWENAYMNHVSNWKKPLGHESFVHADKMNQDNSMKLIRTKMEQQTDPYPSNLQTVCYYDHKKDDDTSSHEDAVELDYHHNQGYLTNHHLKPCDVLERSLSEEYIVRVFPLHNSKLAYPIVLKNVTRNQIKFAPRPYTSNIFEKKAFRHFIGMPDDLFPESWKNLKNDNV